MNTAQAEELRLDLEPQPLGSALKELATKAKVQIRHADVPDQGLTTPGLHGRYSLREALDHLLAGTKLTYDISPQGVVTIQQPAGAANASAANGNVAQLPPLTVTASQMRGYHGLAAKSRTGSYLGLRRFDTPATIDVITREEIEQWGLKDLSEIYDSAPGVITGSNPGSLGTVSMRGFSGATVFLVDGIRVVNSSSLIRNYASYNFQRVEILKGPASIVHGNGALAGAINLVTRKPQLGESYFDVLLSYGSFNTYRTGASFNQPIAEKAAVQASLIHTESDGYIDDTHSWKTGLTTGLLFEPTQRLSLSANFYYFKERYTTVYWGTPLIPRELARNPTEIASTQARRTRLATSAIQPGGVHLSPAKTSYLENN